MNPLSTFQPYLSDMQQLSHVEGFFTNLNYFWKTRGLSLWLTVMKRGKEIDGMVRARWAPGSLVWCVALFPSDAMSPCMAPCKGASLRLINFKYFLKAGGSKCCARCHELRAWRLMAMAVTWDGDDHMLGSRSPLGYVSQLFSVPSPAADAMAQQWLLMLIFKLIFEGWGLKMVVLTVHEQRHGD